MLQAAPTADEIAAKAASDARNAALDTTEARSTQGKPLPAAAEDVKAEHRQQVAREIARAQAREDAGGAKVHPLFKEIDGLQSKSTRGRSEENTARTKEINARVARIDREVPQADRAPPMKGRTKDTTLSPTARRAADAKALRLAVAAEARKAGTPVEGEGDFTPIPPPRQGATAAEWNAWLEREHPTVQGSEVTGAFHGDEEEPALAHGEEAASEEGGDTARGLSGGGGGEPRSRRDQEALAHGLEQEQIKTAREMTKKDTQGVVPVKTKTARNVKSMTRDQLVKIRDDPSESVALRQMVAKNIAALDGTKPKIIRGQKIKPAEAEPVTPVVKGPKAGFGRDKDGFYHATLDGEKIPGTRFQHAGPRRRVRREGGQGRARREDERRTAQEGDRGERRATQEGVRRKQARRRAPPSKRPPSTRKGVRPGRREGARRRAQAEGSPRR